MPLKDHYFAELERKQLAQKEKCASLEEAKAKLKGLYRSIMDDREFYDLLRAEVELLDDDLRIDPGPIMIVITAMPDGALRLEYEVKKPDDYHSTVLGDVSTLDDVERAVAKLLVQYPRDDS